MKAKVKSKIPSIGGIASKEHYDIASLDDAFKVLFGLGPCPLTTPLVSLVTVLRHLA